GESKRDFFGDEWTEDDKNLTHSLWLLTILPTYLKKKGVSRLPSPSLEWNRIISETSEDFVIWGKTNLTKNVQRVEVNVLRDQCMQEVGRGTWRSLDRERNLFSKWMRNFVEGQGLVLKRTVSNNKTLISIVCKEGEGGAEVEATTPSKPNLKRPIIRKNPTTKSNTIDDVFDE
ncbi:MAG: hypothetical protein ACTSWQ_10620, partial [Candidatus Thorarchaeota archaeon]